MFAIDQTKTDQRPENLDGGIFLLVVTGLRYYTPRLGRWTNRDPIGERGGLNLQLFLCNSALWNADILGLLGPPDQQLVQGYPIKEEVSPISKAVSGVTKAIHDWWVKDDYTRFAAALAELRRTKGEPAHPCPSEQQNIGIPHAKKFTLDAPPLDRLHVAVSAASGLDMEVETNASSQYEEVSDNDETKLSVTAGKKPTAASQVVSQSMSVTGPNVAHIPGMIKGAITPVFEPEHVYVELDEACNCWNASYSSPNGKGDTLQQDAEGALRRWYAKQGMKAPWQ